MPGARCAILCCKNNRIKTKTTQENVIYHGFPKKNADTREEWIRRCKRIKSWNPDNWYICSTHFSDSDYERDLQHELLGLPIRKRLKKTALPSLHLPAGAIQKNVLKSVNTKTLIENKSELEKVDSISKLEDDILKIYHSVPEEKYNNLLRKFEHLKLQYASCQRRFRTVNNQLNYYKKKLSRNRYNKKDTSIMECLKKIFTRNQIALILNKKKKVNWTDEEVAVAFTLLCYSKELYLFVKDNMHFPLPGLSSVRRWAAKANLKDEVSEEAVNQVDDVNIDICLQNEDIQEELLI